MSLLQRLVLVCLAVIVVVTAALLVVLRVVFLHLLASQPLEEVGHLLVVERVGEVLTHALEASELALAVAGDVVADVRFAVFVEHIGICGKRGVECKGVTLGQFQSESGGKVTPRTYVRSHIVRHSRSEFVNEANLLISYRVVIRPQFHLNVVGYVHRDTSRLAPSRRTEDAVGVGRVFNQRDVAVGVGLLVCGVVAIATRTEVRSVVERHLGLEHVAYGDDLVAEQFAPRHIETIHRGGCRERHAPVVDVVEAVHRVGNFPLVLLIPRPHNLVGVHSVGQSERGSDVKVVERGEGSAYRYGVLHTVAPVTRQTGTHQFVLLSRYAVAQLSRVRHRNLLIPLLRSRHLLALERVETAYGDVYIRKSEVDGRVAHVLAHVHGGAQRHADARKGVGHAHRRGSRGLRVALRIVHTRQVVALITACGEVHTGRQRSERIGLGVLTVAPLNLETGLFRVVGHVFLTIDGVLETGVEATRIPVTLAIVRCNRQSP